MSIYTFWQEQAKKNEAELRELEHQEAMRRAAIPNSASAFYVRWFPNETARLLLSWQLAEKEKDGTLGKRIGKDYA